jgi:non-ribosomal peptide synthetase component E (peptide arylation enzyme)
MAQSATSSSASSSSSPTGPPRLIQTPEGIYRSPYPTPKFPQKSVWDLIVEPISSDDGKLAIKECDKREQQITYAELKSRSIALAVGMQKKLGLMAGDTV